MDLDDTVAYVGSPNLDMRSFFLNYEDALLLYGRVRPHRAELALDEHRL